MLIGQIQIGHADFEATSQQAIVSGNPYIERFADDQMMLGEDQTACQGRSRAIRIGGAGGR